MPQLIAAREDPRRKLRVGVIGHTGRGNYGHALDTVWLRIRGVEVVGVADPDETGRQRAVQRLKAQRGFEDHHQLLGAVKPEFVSICPRYADQHAEMIVDCAAAGVKGIYVEKPFCRTPAEADRVQSTDAI